MWELQNRKDPTLPPAEGDPPNPKPQIPKKMFSGFWGFCSLSFQLLLWVLALKFVGCWLCGVSALEVPKSGV